ncbi:hypothetical protein [Methylobacterium crusticola]|nr:hypothetical protein [Methylobacterium crusticola]
MPSPRQNHAPDSPADRLAEHLIRAHRLAAACQDAVAMDLIRLALWHVGHTYAPSEEALAEDKPS